MSDYTLSLLALLVALLAQAIASGLATELFLRKELACLARYSWLALAVAALIFALQHGYALELAVSTGLHDLRQAVLSGIASSLLALAVYGFRRRA
jgi:membrane protease YdiL (CAAX protease family)